MEREELKKAFHSFFNKINNIFTAAGSNKMILEDENLDKLSVEELKTRILDLTEALAMIEKNASFLNKSLQELYKTLLKEVDSAVSGLSSPDSSK